MQTDTIDIDTAIDAISEALEANEITTRLWHGATATRIYCSRQLSRRTQEIGFVEFHEDEDGNVTSVSTAFSRRKAGNRRIVEGAIEGLGLALD